ncbi:stage IV sporulation protein A, partial [Gemmiger formicilis]|nr:stage IV sporulation protein A [Gemmiger formicilis]
SVADLPRENYCEAEQRIVEELDAIGKPYIILLNCAEPESDAAQQLAAQMADRYNHAVFPINCVAMTAETLDRLLQNLLYEFPVQ